MVYYSSNARNGTEMLSQNNCNAGVNNPVGVSSGTEGTPGADYYVLGATNITTPLRTGPGSQGTGSTATVTSSGPTLSPQ